MPQPLAESPYRLLVEGIDDKHSVIHLLRRHSFDWDDAGRVRPYISVEGNVEKLLRAIPVAVKGTYERIGVVVDANSDPDARWIQVRDRLQTAGLTLSVGPQPGGVIVPGLSAMSQLGIWLMPDNSSPGALEDFLDKLVAADDPIRAYADEVVIEARQRGARCQEKDHVKSALHTWLAWQERPGMPFGTALEAEVFGKDSADALRFLEWFNRLFIEP